MEKTATQRIIGILVVLALVIILLPLLFDKNDATAKVTAAKNYSSNKPAEPITTATADQSNPTTFIDIPPEVANQVNQSSEVEAKLNTPNVEPTMANPSNNNTDSNLAKLNSSQPLQDSATAEDGVLSKESPTGPATTLTTDDSQPVVEKIIKAVDSQPSSVTNKKHSKSVMKTASSVGTKKQVWAIQMGSFKNKSNAHRLADKLRAAGYKAFTHDVKFQTRVYIGPEFKQASAQKLSSDIEQKLNLHGLIIPYKPFDL